MPPKRTAEGEPKAIDTSSPVMAAFSFFRSELDEHHDRRERIIKASRDITAQSKKIIFALQRHRTLRSTLSPSISSDISTRKDEIRSLLDSVTPDLSTTLNQHRYARQISPGLQELVEAAVFEHYLTHQTLLTQSEAATACLLPEPLHPLLTETDYLLGVYDATGEIMRFAITGMATGGVVPEAPVGKEAGEGGSGVRRNVLTDLREVRAALEGLETRQTGAFGRDCEKKAFVMRQSVEKVESAVYSLIVRGKERPKGWVPEARAEAPREEVEGY